MINDATPLACFHQACKIIKCYFFPIKKGAFPYLTLLNFSIQQELIKAEKRILCYLLDSTTYRRYENRVLRHTQTAKC